MIPTFLDLKTGKRGKGSDASVFWWTEGNGACDCNRAHYVGAEEELEAQMRKEHPDLPENVGFCYGCIRVVAIDVEGDLEGLTVEKILSEMNSEYTYRKPE